jgi:AcrR family transcriptional regulator
MRTQAREGLRERTKKRRVEAILAAARELLRETAGPNLTVDRIAERAEVAPATVFNLVGTREQIWAALAERALGDLDLGSLGPADDPHQRARAIVDSITRSLCADPLVFRALFSGWAQSGRALAARDPTNALVACLEDAADRGMIPPHLNHRRLGELVSSGLIGIMHQWAAGLMSDHGLRTRGRDLVDVAFAAAGAEVSLPTGRRSSR